MVCHTKEEANNQLWYLDTGCSNHMSGDKTIFSSLDESYRDQVKFGNNTKVSVMGKGQVCQPEETVLTQSHMFFLFQT